MRTQRNLEVRTPATAVRLMAMGSCPPLLGSTGTTFLSIHHIDLGDQTDDGGVISNFYDTVEAVCGGMFVEEWAEHAALRDASVDSDCGGCGRTFSSILLRHSKQLKSAVF